MLISSVVKSPSEKVPGFVLLYICLLIRCSTLPPIPGTNFCFMYISACIHTFMQTTVDSIW